MIQEHVTVLTFGDGTYRLLAVGQRLEVDHRGHWQAKWNLPGGAKRHQPLGKIISKVEVMTTQEAATRFSMVVNPVPVGEVSTFDDYKSSEAELKAKRKQA